jgi:predicted ATPase
MDSGRPEVLALGDTPNIAARLQGLTEPDTLVISGATFRLIQGYFACQDLGRQRLKGVPTPIQLYRVLGESGARSRLDVAGPRGLTPFIGREPELTLLQERWRQAEKGHGQVVVLSGEAGIGKSRLVEALTAGLEPGAYTRLSFRCSSYAQQSPLWPVIEHLQRWLPWGPTDPPEAKLDILAQVLQTFGLSLAEAVPLLAALFSVPLPEGRYPPLQMTPQRQREHTFNLLISWLLQAANRLPVLAVWEDLHWADPSTLELLNRMIDQVHTARLLMVLTCRPEFRPPWSPHPHLAQLTLNRLARPQVEAMVDRLAGGKPLPSAVVGRVVAKTDGIPLFVEEFLKMILESGLVQEQEDRYELTGPLPLLAIPTTLQDSLMARLDRLVTAKPIAQLGATLGQRFSYDLLWAVSSLDEAILQQALGRLVAGELLYQQGVPPQATYFFKHVLIQEVAYQSLLKSTREQHHQRIVQVLEARFPETAETQPELLAYHYTQAGLNEQAVGYWQRAGQRAVQGSAYAEAISHLTTALELLSLLPDTPERTRQELDLQITLGPALIATKSQAAPEVEHAYARARALCQQLGETPQLFSVLRGLWAFYVTRGELETAHELGEQLLRMAQQVQDPALLLEAHRVLGTTLSYLGEFVAGLAHLTQSRLLYDPQQHRSQTIHYAQDSGVICLAYMSEVLWYLGYPDQALRRSQEALALARELAHPFSLAFALNFASALHHFLGNGPAVQERAEAAIALASEQGFIVWLVQGRVLRGWGLAEQGRGTEGIAQMREGLAAWRAMGAELGRPYYLGLLAEAYAKMGQTEAGLSALAEALAATHKHGEHYCVAELYRLQGELLLAGSSEQHAEVQTYFEQALDVARGQQAKSLELRAAISLSRLWQQQGKRADVCQLLAPIYGWFTEGFDTADLREAKALLDGVS